MPRDSESSYERCLVFLVIGGLVVAFFVPLAALVALVCAVPVVVMYLYRHRMPKPETEGEDTSQGASPAFSGSAKQPEGIQPSTEAMSGAASEIDRDARRPASSAQLSPSLKASGTQAEKGPDSIEKLQARINELEERVRLLRERLAGGPTGDTITVAKPVPDTKSLETPPTNDAEELSERALQHLLEALDEKLAKGAITQQLYQRLRDKYLARLSKARGKREAAPQVVSSKPRRRR